MAATQIECSEYDMEEATTLEREVMTRAGQVLVKHFPFTTWDVSFDHGVLKIQCPELFQFENRPYGFNVPYHHIHTDEEWEKKLMMAGGQLLDAAWVRTDTGVRIKDKVDKPNDGS
jgi:hypothetical protein